MQVRVIRVKKSCRLERHENATLTKGVLGVLVLYISLQSSAKQQCEKLSYFRDLRKEIPPAGYSSVCLKLKAISRVNYCSWGVRLRESVNIFKLWGKLWGKNGNWKSFRKLNCPLSGESVSAESWLYLYIIKLLKIRILSKRSYGPNLELSTV